MLEEKNVNIFISPSQSNFQSKHFVMVIIETSLKAQ